jgi:hypothetical protein
VHQRLAQDIASLCVYGDGTVVQRWISGSWQASKTASTSTWCEGPQRQLLGLQFVRAKRGRPPVSSHGQPKS